MAGRKACAARLFKRRIKGKVYMHRRQFLEAAAALGMTGGAERLRLRAFAPSSAPAGRELLDSLLLLDANGRPFELLPRPTSDGALEIGLPDDRFEIMMTLPVRNFGQVYLFADNGGTLYSSSAAQAELLLNYE